MPAGRLIAVFAALVLILGALDADAKRRKRKKKRKGAVGALALKCDQPGALVFVDDKQVGKTPIKQLAVSAGEHSIKVKKPGYLYFTRKINVKRGKTVRLKAELLPFAGVIYVTANAKQARVWVDEEEVGVVPLEYEVKLGSRQIAVKADGFKTFRKRIRATPGKRYRIKARLKRGRDPEAAAPALVALAPPLEPPAELPLEAPDALPLEGPAAPPPEAPDTLALAGPSEPALEPVSDSTSPEGDFGDDLALAPLAPPPTEETTTAAVKPGAAVEPAVDELALAMPPVSDPEGASDPAAADSLALEGLPATDPPPGDLAALEGLPSDGLSARKPNHSPALAALPGLAAEGQIAPPPPPIYKRWYFITGVAGGIIAAATAIIVPVAVASSSGGPAEELDLAQDGVWRPGADFRPEATAIVPTRRVHAY